MDTDISRWVLEFLLRQTSLDDRLLNVLIRKLPLPNNDPNITKSLILRKLESDIKKGTISERTLELIEQIEELDHEEGNTQQTEELDDGEGNTEVSEAMKAAYCAVAVHCTVKSIKESPDDDNLKYFNAVSRIWRGRISKMEKFDVTSRVGLISDDLLGWMDDLEAGVWVTNYFDKVLMKYKELDVSNALSVFINEAKEKMGPSFLELVSNTLSIDTLKEVLDSGKEKEHHEQNKETVTDNAPNVKEDDIDGGVLKDLKKKGPKISLMERNSTARVFEWSESDHSSEKGSPKKRPIQSLKCKNSKVSKSRKRMKWSILEEDTLRTAVLKYGKGNWKMMLKMYGDIFVDRTEVDLKDKWRNLTR